MKFGATYPQIELGGDPAALDAFGRAAEQLGYDYLAMADHVAGAEHADRETPLWGPYTEKDPFHDPLVSFAYLAGVTRRIEFVSGVLVLPQRPTVLVARQAADVDLLSGGRLRLGVGVGWNHIEFQALGQDFHRRGKRMSEQMVLLRRLWDEPVIDFQGEFERIDRAGINPRPRRRIPLYCGGISEPAFRRAAELADGFIFGGGPDSVDAAWRRIRELLDERGRAVADFGADYQTPDGTSVRDAVDLARRWQDAGGTHLSVRTTKLDYGDVQQHIDHIAEANRLLKDAIAPG